MEAKYILPQNNIFNDGFDVKKLDKIKWGWTGI